MKREYSRFEWDALSFNDLVRIEPALSTIYRKTEQKGGTKLLKRWAKMLLSRMGRERLLGKNMSKFDTREFH